MTSGPETLTCIADCGVQPYDPMLLAGSIVTGVVLGLVVAIIFAAGRAIEPLLRAPRTRREMRQS